MLRHFGSNVCLNDDLHTLEGASLLLDERGVQHQWRLPMMFADGMC